MICIWCDRDTTDLPVDAEHIFPESVGGIQTLQLGKVCKDCNNRLGNEVDGFLKKSNYAFLIQYQNSSHLLKKPVGKKGDKKRKERKKAELYDISHYNGGTKINRSAEDFHSMVLTNLPSGTSGDLWYDKKFSRAIHKCALNCILHEKDYLYVKQYPELIDFINNEDCQDSYSWSYGISYFNLFSYVHFEPFWLQMIESEGLIYAVVLIFPAAICVVGTKPNIVSEHLLGIAGSNPPEIEAFKKNGFDYLKHFESSFSGDERILFGEKIKFNLIKKEIPGILNPSDVFYLLTSCKACGQTNPTGINLGKEPYLEREHTSWIGGTRNSWNRFTNDDLQVKGFEIEKWDEESLESYKNQGITYPAIHDVKRLNIKNCGIACINCKHWIVFDAKDCFI